MFETGGKLNRFDTILLHDGEPRFRQIVEDLPAAIYTCDAYGRITFCNEAAVELWGRRAQLGKDLWCGSWKIFRPDGSPLPLDECPMAVTLKEGRPVKGEEIIIERPDGIRRCVLPHPMPLFDSRNNIAGAVNMLVDITEKKIADNKIIESEKKYRMLADLLEKKVEKRTLELKKRNEELEQFAYIASHDLQEPLRKIQLFSELLEKDLDDDELTKKNISKIKTSARRMTQLIRDVLNYSRIAKTDEEFTEVDLELVVQNIKTDYEVLINERNATISHSNLPVIKGLPVQIHQLFSNLISNSLKFNDENPVVDIRYSFITDGNDYPILKGKPFLKLTFRDNGIGFEQQYSKQIFNLFHCLNDRSKYLGTGVGLALCKRIVENHHGHIFADSEVNKGAVFTVFLPAQV